MTELLEQIKKDYAKENGEESWVQFKGFRTITNRHVDEIATRYATEVAKRSLEKAAESATISYGEGCNILIIHDYDIEVNKQSISDESNISL